MKEDAPRVIKIPAKPEATRQAEARRQLRVAAYCRVSTKEEDQANSYEVQKEYYTDKIMSNTAWTMAGIFADKGITGTSAKKREDFMRMIRHCRQKKIDVILTKSVSRFSRNTVDCLYYIRALKQLGIAVIFEKENINSLEEDSELRITLSGAFAQSESESISANVTWGKRRAMEAGKVSIQYKKLYGYRKGEDGQPEIIPEQAEIVRWLYERYLTGASLRMIKDELEQQGVKCFEDSPEWTISRIRSILQNEKYCGDVLLQKTFTDNVLTGGPKKNTGQLPQYYIENNHEGIVTKQMYREVQAEIARRNSKSCANRRKQKRGRYNSKYALSERLYCGECGSPYKRVTWNIHGRKEIVWRCVNRVTYGTKFCHNSPSVQEEVLHQTLLRAIQNLADNYTDEVAMQINGILHDLQGGTTELEELQQKLADARQEFDRLLDLSLECDASFLDDKVKRVSKEIDGLKKRIEVLTANQQKAADPQYQLSAEDFQIKEYSDALVARIVEKVIVLSADEIKIEFVGGYTVNTTSQE